MITSKQIHRIPKLSKTMRAIEIAEKFNVEVDTIYHYARVLRNRGEVVLFRRATPGVKPKI